MRIVYAPLINLEAQLGEPETNLDGEVIIPSIVKGKQAKLVMSMQEASKLFDQLEALDVRGLAKVY